MIVNPTPDAARLTHKRESHCAGAQTLPVRNCRNADNDIACRGDSVHIVDSQCVARVEAVAVGDVSYTIGAPRADDPRSCAERLLTRSPCSTADIVNRDEFEASIEEVSSRINSALTEQVEPSLQSLRTDVDGVNARVDGVATDLTSEATRATAAEGALQRDIGGLRTQLGQEASARGQNDDAQNDRIEEVRGAPPCAACGASLTLAVARRSWRTRLRAMATSLIRSTRPSSAC